MAVVGIDLGTTRSVVAAVSPDGSPTALYNADGNLTLPSVVLFDGPQSKVVGRIARQHARAEPERVVENVKRHMGKATEWRFFGERYTPEQISAVILRRLKDDAEAALKEPITGAVITVPANFGDRERHATRVAADIAGIPVISILDEPAAAAIAYGFGGDAGSRAGTVLLYDLGGGTFDVTVMEVADGVHHMLATQGDQELGGIKWDEAIVNHVAEGFIAKHGADPRLDPGVRQALWRDAEAAKEALSSVSTQKIVCDHGGNRVTVELSREQFERITSDLLGQTETTVQLVLEAVQEKGKLAGGWSEIDRVLLVGGSSRMPQVSRMLRGLSGKDPDALPMELVVAHGAALYAHIKTLQGAGGPAGPNATAGLGLTSAAAARLRAADVRRVCSFALGVAARDRGSDELVNTVVVPENSELPCILTERFVTASEGQTAVHIQVYEGSDPMLQNCAKLGEGRITGIPPGLPKGSPLEVTIGLDDECRVQVSAVELTHGRQCAFELRRTLERSPADIAVARERLAADQVA